MRKIAGQNRRMTGREIWKGCEKEGGHRKEESEGKGERRFREREREEVQSIHLSSDHSIRKQTSMNPFLTTSPAGHISQLQPLNCMFSTAFVYICLLSIARNPTL